MKHLYYSIFAILILLPFHTIQAETQLINFELSGEVIDSITHEGEPYATLRIFKSDNLKKVVKIAATGVNGKFKEQFSGIGHYILQINSLGKKQIQLPFEISSSHTKQNFGTVLVTDDAQAMNEITVIQQKPLVQMEADKVAYSVEDDPDSKHNMLMEMLRKVPMVTVDGEYNIKINGSSNFAIHLNGRPNSMLSKNPKEIFKSMPASQVKRIEVITEPGVKYDAEGIGGILNIVTIDKTKFTGYTATISGDVRTSGYGTGIYSTFKLGDKITFSINGHTGWYGNQSQKTNATRLDFNQTDTSSLNWNSHTTPKGNYRYINTEASYEIDTLRLITLSFGLWGNGNKSDVPSEYRMVNNLYGSDYNYNNFNTREANQNSINGGLDYQRGFKRNKQELLTLSYKISTNPTHYKNKLTFDYDQSANWVGQLDLTNRKNNSTSDIIENTFQIDYTRPFLKSHNIEAGAKYIIRNNISTDKYYKENNSGEMVYNTIQSSDFKYANNIGAAYLGYNYKYKSLFFKTGVRYEYTKQSVKYYEGRGTNFEISYQNLVPSIMLSYKLAKTQNIRLGYNLRIHRPSITYLNPFINDIDPLNIKYGNPSLDTEKGHVVNLNYSNFNRFVMLNTSLSYSYMNNGIEKYDYIGTNNEALNQKGTYYSTYVNGSKRQELSFNAFINLNIFSKVRIYGNINASYVDMTGKTGNLKNSGFQGMAYSGINYQFPWKINTGGNYFLNIGNVSLQGNTESISSYSIYMSRSFVKDRLNISLYASNFINKYNDYTSHTNSNNFNYKSVTEYPNRSFGINVSYRFGELKAQVKRVARSITNDDMKSGSSEGQGTGQEGKGK